MAWLNRLTVEARCGDLFAMACQAIIVNTDVALSLCHTLGRELLAHCGEPLSRDVWRILDAVPRHRLALGQASTVPAYDLGAVEKVILVAWWDRAHEFTSRLIETVLTSALRQAFAAKF